MKTPSGYVEKFAHTPLAAAISVTSLRAVLSSSFGKNICRMPFHAAHGRLPLAASLIKCSRPLPANDSVMGASLNVLSMLGVAALIMCQSVQWFAFGWPVVR